MSEIGALGYLAIFAGSTVLGLVLVPLALRVALRRGILDHPGGHKSHSDPVPYLGGVAIALAFSIAVSAAALLRPPDDTLVEVLALLGSAVAVSLLGLLDDLRGLGPVPRLVVVTVAALVLAGVGIRVDLFDAVAIDVIVTVVWILGVTNAFNLLDNMDGLAAGVAAIGAGAFFLIAAVHGQFLVAALSVALLGCSLAFLRHNLHPARMYMGDAGSLFLGFLLAALGVKLSLPTSPVIAAFVPVLVLGMALLDTALVVVTRLARGRSPLQGGRDHISHRLVVAGASPRFAVLLVHLTAFGLGWLGLVMARLEDLLTAYLLLGFTLASLLVAGVLLALVPVGDAPERPAPALGSDERRQRPS